MNSRLIDTDAMFRLWNAEECRSLVAHEGIVSRVDLGVCSEGSIGHVDGNLDARNPSMGRWNCAIALRQEPAEERGDVGAKHRAIPAGQIVGSARHVVAGGCGGPGSCGPRIG